MQEAQEEQRAEERSVMKDFEEMLEEKERVMKKAQREEWLEGRLDAFDGTRPGRFGHARRPGR